MVVWLIGLSGAGKTTVAAALRDRLQDAGRPVVMLDGDVVRELFGNDLGHSLPDRRKNAERISRLCQFLSAQGIMVVCAILSLFEDNRTWNRRNIPEYFEVYLQVSIATLKARDTKGLYARAATGELRDVAGIDLHFPEPRDPDLVLANDFTTPPRELADRIWQCLKRRQT